MDDEAVNGFRTTRWLAWATAGLLAAGVVSAGTVSAAHKQADTRIVTAAGDSTGGVDLPTTEAPTVPTAPTVPPVPPTAPPAPPVPGPPASATSPGTIKPVTTTTAAKAATTTAPPSGEAQPQPRSTTTTPPASTTPTTISGRATVTIVSRYGYDVDVSLNGRTFRVAANQSVGPIDLALAANGNDVVEARLVVRPECGMGDAGGYFTAGGTFTLTITPVPGGCFDLPGFTLKSTAA